MTSAICHSPAAVRHAVPCIGGFTLFFTVICAIKLRQKSPSRTTASPTGLNVPCVPVAGLSHSADRLAFSGFSVESRASFAFFQSLAVSSVDNDVEGEKMDPVVLGPSSGIISEKMGMEFAHPPNPMRHTKRHICRALGIVRVMIDICPIHSQKPSMAFRSKSNPTKW